MSSRSFMRLLWAIPPRYRELAKIISVFLTTLAVSFLVVILSSAAGVSIADVFGKYILVLCGIFILFIYSIYNAICELKDDFFVKKMERKTGEQTNLDALTVNQKNKDKFLSKLYLLIAAGKLFAVVNIENNTISACANGIAPEQMLPESILLKQKKKFAIFNFVGIAIILLANLINLYLIINIGLSFYDGLFSGMGAGIVAAVFIFQISMFSYLASAKAFRDAKYSKAKGRKTGFILAILNLIFILVWIALVFITISLFAK